MDSVTKSYTTSIIDDKWLANGGGDVYSVERQGYDMILRIVGTITADKVDPPEHKDSIRHSISDEPSQVKDGWRAWHSCGKLHRDNGPAIIGPDGTSIWCQHGFIHRDNEPAITFADGALAWINMNVITRANDKPAFVCAKGTQKWYLDGNLHRGNDQPAVIITRNVSKRDEDGYIPSCTLHADCERISMPYKRHLPMYDTIIRECNCDLCYMLHNKVPSRPLKMWYLHGALHREGGRPAIIDYDGTKLWYVDGALHRIGGGPAIDTSYGAQLWYERGLLHREGGPAIIYNDLINGGYEYQYENGEQRWYQRGKRHRLDGPAIIWPKGQRAWYVDGRMTKYATANAIDTRTPFSNL